MQHSQVKGAVFLRKKKYQCSFSQIPARRKRDCDKGPAETNTKYREWLGCGRERSSVQSSRLKGEGALALTEVWAWVYREKRRGKGVLRLRWRGGGGKTW